MIVGEANTRLQHQPELREGKGFNMEYIRSDVVLTFLRLPNFSAHPAPGNVQASNFQVLVQKEVRKG